MVPLEEILAKSRNYGNLTLVGHTQQVAAAILKFARNFDYPFDISLARKAAILHDLGKAHPHFQRKIKNLNSRSLSEQRDYNYVHRHEISSLGFLPVFPKEEWNILIEAVIGHHKSIKNDAGEKGILDLIEKYSDCINNHLQHWEEWHLYGLEVLKSFGIPIRNVSKIEASQVLNYVIDYCETKKSGWSPWRGLLKSADHYASAFMHDTQSQLKSLFENPDLSFFHSNDRKSELYPLSTIPTNDPRMHTLVVAPTGAGKTDILLKRCTGRVFYTLPFQASINAMWERIKKVVPNKDIRLLHATSKLVVGKQLEEQILQPLSGSSVKVLTPHQLAAIVFCTSGFESVMLDVKGTDVILDEIHTYNDYAQAMVLEIVKALKWLNCRIHIGTATMPSTLYKELLNILGGTESVYEVSLDDEVLDKFDRHTVNKLDDAVTVNGILKTAFAQREKILMIYNTVGAAQKAFEKFKEDFPDIEMMLIHSRYRRGDRVNLEHQLKKKYNGDESSEGFRPCLVVSTQVVEVSLDISFDRMITQCAPLDALIQRFGRVNRKRTEDTLGKYKPVHVLKPFGNSLPYNKEIIEASFSQLPDNNELLKERTLQTKIDSVYPTLNKKDIDIHLKFKEGKFLLRELTDNKKAVMVEALEIESATCILSCDREKYETAPWEDRLQMEIPINFKTITRQKKNYEQLKIGAYPFVIPQDLDRHKIYGLELAEHENII